MFFTQLPDMPLNMSDEQVIQSNEWLEHNVATEIWTTAVVSAKFKISAARLNQLHKKYQIPGHIKLGATHLYIARYAQPWFEAHELRKKHKKVKVEVKKPKKVKGEYTYTLWGQEYTDSLPPKTVWNNWLGYIASQYPQFYRDGKFENVIGELIMQQPPELKSALAEVNKVFRKLTAGD